MYIPRQFREEDLAVLHTLMRNHSFATLVSVKDNGLPVATPLPFVVELDPAPYGTLKAHMARGNPQWQTFQPDREVLVIFQGPHSYVSPSWYDVELSVPTWNYATVHAYGHPRIMDDQTELLDHLRMLIAMHESQFEAPWPFQLPADYVEKMMKGTVGFEIRLTHLEGKFKLSQNRSPHEQEEVAEQLSLSLDTTVRGVAALMHERQSYH